MKNFYALFALVAAVSLSLAPARADDTNVIGRTFSSPEEAVSAMQTAANNHDTNALADIFGPGFADIRTSDPVEGQNELKEFADSFSVSNYLDHVADDRCILDTGTDRWPFPIPIVHGSTGWYFDTAAGKDELINRRVGRDELQAIKSMRVAAEAQREYASANHSGDEVLEFAQKLVSSPGKKDGLYWSPDIDGEISPLGPAFVAAQDEGYLKDVSSENSPQPFHGYFFKLLTRQGKHAPGDAYNYIINGHMIGGFAFVAWPAQYGESGVMTFIINQQGRVYQKDLGPDTGRLVKKMKAYDPDSSWTVTTD